MSHLPDGLFLAESGFSYAITHSHLPGLIVAAILVLLSVVSWSVMFTKLGMASKAGNQNYRFMYAFRNAKTAIGPWEANITVTGSPLFSVYRAACRELSYHLLGTTEVKDDFHQQVQVADRISPDQMDSVRSAMDRSMGEAVLHLESRMTFLATAVSGAPFLGLLGTVWGVMETFSGVASGSGDSTLTGIAPGVSAALVTTVIALLVAIPAMFGYNFLINRIRTMVLEMNNFSAELTTLFEREYVDFSRGSIPAASGSGQESRPSMSGMGRAAVSAKEEDSELDSFRPRTRADRTDEDGVPLNPIAEASRKRTRES